MKNIKGFRIFYYLMGLLVLALGIILNTKSQLGVSPIISISYAASEIGHLNFGNITFMLYGSFVLIEMILHVFRHRHPRPTHTFKTSLKSVLFADFLQLPLSLVFTRFMNLFSALLPTFSESSVKGYAVRIIVLIIAVILTGIGASLSLETHIVPNPGDGIVQAIADVSGLSVGLTKNFLDLTCIVLSITLGLLCTGHLVGIGLGTVIAVIGTGRVIAVFNHFTQKKILSQSGLL